jgi:hypothetical protein
MVRNAGRNHRTKMFPSHTSRRALERAAPRRGAWRHVGCALGILAAALLFEVGLRPIFADWNYPPAAIRTSRNYTEGISVAHFEADGLGQLGNRLTGNPPLAGAPEGVIVGDSHVAAQAVRDEETMGAIIERLSRTAGHPLNVRQYGWPSANAPTFLATAASLLERRNPAWVAVVLNAYNIGAPALTATGNWRMELGPGDSFRLIEARPRPSSGWRITARRWVAHSTLAMALAQRLGLIRSQRAANASAQQSAVGSDESAGVPRATVLGLKEAYGARLLIVYTPSLLGAGHIAVDATETEVLRLCAEEHVACISVRAALEQDRNDYLRLSRGFHNTAPGVGHFNAIGHRIIGQEVWRYLAVHAPAP